MFRTLRYQYRVSDPAPNETICVMDVVAFLFKNSMIRAFNTVNRR